MTFFSGSRLIWVRIKNFFIPERLFLLSFAGIIVTGAVLLHQPFAVHGAPLSFTDALFTSTSATCVTGLIVVDTATRFTFAGQLIILLLIQMGGLGIMTFSVAFATLFAGRLSLGGRDMLEAAFSQMPMRGMRHLLRTIFFATLITELIGALLLSLRFSMDMPIGKALWFGLFHAVSAFCNAGFALFSDSLVSYQGDVTVIMVISALIIAGGAGFIVLFELQHQKRPLRFKSFSLHTRVVISMSAFLLAFGFTAFILFEWGSAWSHLPWGKKILEAFFQSVTTRTAGFNSVDIATLSNATLFFIIILMFIGASPSSTGGGIKTTTLATILALARARFKNREHAEIMNRSIPETAVSKAVTLVIFASLVIVFFTTLLLFTELKGVSHQESRGMFLELLFEATSAFGTVGLSTGVTPHLSQAGRWLITALMFIGRLGPLTLALAIGQKKSVKYQLAKEDLLIG
ncbi:MAG: Trk family potassium uptake protein [Calditrichaeota bacterium]|nr:MAG: Trk family potassium uptake protein [Calditrichota bacterium]